MMFMQDTIFKLRTAALLDVIVSDFLSFMQNLQILSFFVNLLNNRRNKQTKNTVITIWV